MACVPGACGERGMRVIVASMARGGERGARGASAERITRENTAQPNRHSNKNEGIMCRGMSRLHVDSS